MTKQEIIDSLEMFSTPFPKEALREAQKMQEGIIPELLDSLDYANQNADKLCDEESPYYFHVYAMYLLSEFREKRAFPKLIAFLHQPEEQIDYLLGDSLSEDFPALLCSTYDGESVKMLQDVTENPEAYEYARSSALRAYAFLYEEGLLTQEEIIEYFRFLIHDKLLGDESYAPTSLVNCVVDAKFTQLIPDVRLLYDNNCVDTGCVGGYDSFIDHVFSDTDYRKEQRYINDTVAELESWACFRDESANDDNKFAKTFEDMVLEGIKEDRKQNRILAQKNSKMGRNDPCPCGSGKKYKKCCYDKDKLTAPSIRLEDKYDLLKRYPKDSPLFAEMFDAEAINIDITVYKALHHREIPMWVQRDLAQEKLGKIYYLKEALELFSDKCRREHITSFSTYDERYMVHYRSRRWVEALINLVEDSEASEINTICRMAEEALDAFGN